MTETVTRDSQRGQVGHFKDEILVGLADRANVAQFVSFAPGDPPSQRHARIGGIAPDVHFLTVGESIQALLLASGEKSVNVRSFDPSQPKSHEFVYGMTSVAEAVAVIRRLAGAGLHTIANETIDVNDGGVSGVAYGEAIEFAPEDTPRAVERPGTAIFSLALGRRLLETVYGFAPDLDFAAGDRVEFSLHPVPRGYNRTHTVVWEIENLPVVQLQPTPRWPNRFSRHLGDKAFGLLVADLVGLPVPQTLVVPRSLSPFAFGRRTGTSETWLRTAPREPEPGRYSTVRGWTDPFKLVMEEDPQGEHLGAVLAQEGVSAAYSGAAVADAHGNPIVEGVVGAGDGFMLGNSPPSPLPNFIVRSVRELYRQASEVLGPVRFEWVHDGSRVWLVQLHQGISLTQGMTIYPGKPDKEHEFRVEEGLERLRDLIQRLANSSDGVVVVGDIGITSHFGDVLRKARIPSRLERPAH